MNRVSCHLTQLRPPNGWQVSKAVHAPTGPDRLVASDCAALSPDTEGLKPHETNVWNPGGEDMSPE